jgi:hypothetical protein
MSNKPSLDKEYWNSRYEQRETGWDMGTVSPPLKMYIDQIGDKRSAILIPGCGNAHEAEYLLQQGFTNVTLIDIAPSAVGEVKNRLSQFLGNQLQVICGDFFDLDMCFDIILEQTFFCALDPEFREKYADKMHDLLNVDGKLAGVLFNRDFEGGPPFGGNKTEYSSLFGRRFEIKCLENCYNSISSRAGSEVFFVFKKGV